jgi:hypothetical protein
VTARNTSPRRRYLVCALVLLAAVATSGSPAAAATSAPATPLPPTSAVATAAGVGVVSALPSTGTDEVPLNLATSAVCPAGATNVIGTILGPGLPSIGINVVPNSPQSLYPRTSGGGVYLSSNNTLRNLVNELPDPQVLKGTYTLRVECRGPSKIADLGDFYGSLVFDGHHGYVAKQAIPAASLTTVPAPEGPPIPSAIGSHAPETAATSTTSAKAGPTVVTGGGSTSSRSYAPWLIGLGIVVVLGGLGSLLHGRREGHAKPTGAAT